MEIRLIDVDGHNFPNVPLMKISAYHKAQGDSVKWYNPHALMLLTVYLKETRTFLYMSLLAFLLPAAAPLPLSTAAAGSLPLSFGTTLFLETLYCCLHDNTAKDRPADTFYYNIGIKTVNRIMRADKQRIRG